MVVHHAEGLHHGVDGRRAEEAEAPAAQLPAEGRRLGRHRRDVGHRPRHRAGAGLEAPEQRRQRRPGRLQVQGGPGIG